MTMQLYFAVVDHDTSFKSSSK